MSESRLIKKYSNRRLYDTRDSRYITLQDVCRMLNQKADIRVVEQRSGYDITRIVLLQVVVELEATELTRLSTPFLLNLVRSYATADGAGTKASASGRRLVRPAAATPGSSKGAAVSAALRMP